MSLPLALSVLGVQVAKLINLAALALACPGAGLLHLTRRREQRDLAALEVLSRDRAIDQPMLFLDVQTLRRQRRFYRLGFALLGLALLLSWASTRLAG